MGGSRSTHLELAVLGQSLWPEDYETMRLPGRRLRESRRCRKQDRVPVPLTASATLPDEARRLLYERALDALRSGEATRTGTLESTRESMLRLVEEPEQ